MKNICCIKSLDLAEGGREGNGVGCGTYNVFLFTNKTFLLSFSLFVQL